MPSAPAPTPIDDAPPAWKLWAGSTLVLVLALIATPSEIDNGDICPRPAGWLIVHPMDESQSHEFFDPAKSCNAAAPKRGLGGAAVALLGAGLTLRSYRREQHGEERRPDG
jgi:hypothetical protein